MNTKERNYKKIITIIIIALIVVIGATMGVRAILGSIHESTDNRATVDICIPEIRDIEVYTQQIGTIMPDEYVAVIPMVVGEVEEVHFNIGDRVKEGDLLCVVHSDNLESARIGLDGAEIQLNDAKLNLERMQALYESGAISKSNLEQIESAVKGAQLQYDSSKNAYDLLVKYTNITAPIDGVIESKGVSVHDYTSQTTPVAVITADGGKKLTFGVGEDSAKTLVPGDMVEVEIGTVKYAAKVTEVASMIGTSGLHQAQAIIDTKDEITTGLRVKVNLIKNRERQVLTVPQTSVYYSGNDAFVYVLDVDKAAKRSFTPGIYDEEYIQVLSGFSAEDVVISSWDRELYDGAPVIVNE